MVYAGCESSGILESACERENYYIDSDERDCISEGSSTAVASSTILTLGEVLRKPKLIRGILRKNRGWLIVRDPVEMDFRTHYNVWQALANRDIPIRIIMGAMVWNFSSGITLTKVRELARSFKQE